MVTITMEQLLDFRNSVDVFAETTLPLKGAYKLNKIKKAVEKEYEFYAEKFQKIVDIYGQKNENGELIFSDDGNQILIKEGMIDECNQVLEDLQNLEIQIENYELSLEDLGEDIECTPDELEALIPFME